MLIEDLKRFKDEVVKKAEDASFVLASDTNCANASSVKWSKGGGISFIPYELEMSGIKPSRLSAKEPVSKKKYKQILLCGGAVK
ncbi:hypothetical protein [Pseudomonas putida]